MSRAYCKCGERYPDVPFEYILELRGVEHPCTACRGLGCRWYSSGATWRGGMGTATPACDVCDACWGTGDVSCHGVDLREMRDNEEERIATRAAEVLARAVGASMANCRPAISCIINALTKLSNKRGAPEAPWLPELSQALANTLRRAIGSVEVRKWR